MKDLLDLTHPELEALLKESQETLAKQNFQHALKQLQDTAYLNVLRKDIARMKTIINDRNRSKANG